VICRGDHADGPAADLTPAQDAQGRTEGVRRVDEDERRAERAVGAVQWSLDVLRTKAVSCRRGEPLRRG